MFRSVFSKYVCAFVLIICISFAMLSALISAMISSYANDKKVSDLEWASASASEIVANAFFGVTDYNDFSNLSPHALEGINGMLQTVVNSRSGMTVVVVGENGKIYAASDKRFIGDRTLPMSVLSLVAAENGTYHTTGDMDGYLDTKNMIVACPIYEKDGAVVGYAFSFVPSSAEDALVDVVERTVLMSSLWVMLAAIVAAYFISDYMVNPLKTMVKATEQFAKGDFETRVPIISGRNELTELSQAFNEMAESLDSAEKSRQTFLSNVAHDLRTPMTTISGFIDGMRSGAIPTEKQDHYLDVISKEVHRLSRLVSQLLEITRYESGKRKLVGTDFDICEMARLILISFEQKIDEKSLDVDFDVLDDTMTVHADKDAIYQVFYNLCDNAIKFSRERGKFRICIGEENEKRYRISVYNEGEGIHSSEISHVFDRFYKSDESRGKDKSGFGIGLYIAKTIIDGHGETISVESVAGEYCEFAFTLKKAAKSAANTLAEKE